MKQLIFATSDNWQGCILRLTAGLVLLPHGAQKMLGLFGGYGFSGTMSYFTDVLHLPWIIGFLVIVIEFFGALALIAGVGTRIGSALVLVLMIGIVCFSHLEFGFFMNWFGDQKGEGFEYHLLFIGMSAALMFTGGGKYSVDRWLSAKPRLKSPE